MGPRDGLQNEKTVIPTDIKLQYIDQLVNAGLKNIEVTSFVRAPKIPQMADAKELYGALKAKKYWMILLLSMLI